MAVDTLERISVEEYREAIGCELPLGAVYERVLG